MNQPSTILIVEDDADIRSSLEWLLSLEGYATLSAANGQDAIDALARSKADLVLLDLMMPVMNGSEFLSRLRSGALNAESTLPVIILSAAGEVATALVQTQETFLKKPVDSDRLLTAVAKALK